MSSEYHHGNLRTAIIERSLAIIADEGVDALSLRAVASELGVSHAAPRHHFANRRALLTAIATEGYAELGSRTAAVRDAGGSFLEAGLAYVRFALENPAKFAVMFDPTLVDHSDPTFAAAADRTLAVLQASAARHHADADAAALAGWSLMHGFSALALSGALAQAGFAPKGVDLVALAARAASLLSAAPPGEVPAGTPHPHGEGGTP
ncbi:MAG: TetR/AcrR family transcriptional regulator [bacterium]|nr:TetR/AcrR family transcriptional regulator [bacterium]